MKEIEEYQKFLLTILKLQPYLTKKDIDAAYKIHLDPEKAAKELNDKRGK